MVAVIVVQVILSLILLLYIYRMDGMQSPNTLLNAYIFVSIIVLLYTSYSGLDYLDFKVGRVWYSAMPMSGLEDYISKANFVMLFMQLLTVAASLSSGSLVGINKKQRKINLSSVREVINNKIVVFSVCSAYLIVLFMNALHFIAIDKAVIWRTDSYLSLYHPLGLGINGSILTTYHSVFKFPCVIAGFLSIAYFVSKKRLLSFVCASAWAYGFSYALISSSRWSVLYVLVLAAAVAILYDKKARSIAVPLIVFVALNVYMYAMYSRNQGVYGASTIAQNLRNFGAGGILTSFRGLVVNTFEGGLNLANSIRLSPVFTFRYQLLSFSPLISAIDGYESIRNIDRAKFAQFVPMGAVGEVYHFSLHFKIFYVLTFYLCARYASRIARSNNIIHILPKLIISYAYLLMLNYSVRTSYRFLLLFGVVVPIIQFFMRTWKARSH